MSAPLLMLKELGTIHTGSTPKTNDESLFGGDVPFVTPGDLDSVSPIQSTPRTLTEAGVKTADLLPAESVLVCCIGSLGKIGFAGRPVVTNQQINAVVFNPAAVHARYGFFACRMLKPQLELMAPATTVPIVNKSRFSELRIPVPPLEEQRRIAAILDQAETLRTQRRQALAHLDLLTQSLFLDMFGDPTTNPKGWELKTIGELCEVKGGKRLPKGAEYSSTPTQYRYIRVTNLSNGQVDESALLYLTPEVQRSIARYVVAKGDVIISIAGSIGLIAPVPASLHGANLTENAAKLVARRAGEYLPDFLAFMLSTKSVQDQIDSHVGQVTIGKLALFRIEKLAVPLPPLSLQQTFATRIQAIEALKATHHTALAQLDALFASLQQRAFAGEL